MTLNIAGIKIATGQTNLVFVRQMEQDNKEVPTPWVAHWDDTTRTRIVMHENVLQIAKADPTAPKFLLKKEVKLAHKSATGDDVKEYTMYVVVTPMNIEATF